MVVESREGGTLRRIRDVGLLSYNGGKIETELLATWDAKADTFSVLEDESSRQSLATRLGMETEAFEAGLAKRETFLRRLLDDGLSSIPEVEAAVAEFKAGG